MSISQLRDAPSLNIIVGNITANNITSQSQSMNSLTLSGNLSVGGNITSPGLTSSGSSVSLLGNASVSGTSTMGPIVTSMITLNGNQNMTGNLDISGNQNMTGTLDISGNENITGNVDIMGTVDISGNEFITGNVIINGNISANNLNLATGTISSAQVKTLGSVGYQILPAVSGMTYIIYGMLLNYVYGGTAYTPTGQDFILSTVHGSPSGQMAAGNLDTGFIDQSSNQTMTIITDTVNVPTTTFANKALLLTFNGGSNPTTGNGTLTYSLVYALVSCP